MIVLIGGEKGGTGKSTLSTTLAAMAAQRGRDVVLIYADVQGTSSMWGYPASGQGHARHSVLGEERRLLDGKPGRN